MDIKHKVVIATGAGRGMGRAIAKQLASEGAYVVLVAKTKHTLQEVADEIGASSGEAMPIPTDITKREQVEAMVEQVVARYGTMDVLVNCAFWGPPASLDDTTEEFWDRTLDTCLKAPYLCTRAVVPIMRQQQSGRIINIGSKAGKMGEDNRTAYCAAKWGLEGLTAALAIELLKDNIHVHLISPAATFTPFWTENARNLTQDSIDRMIPAETIAATVSWVLHQPDQVNINDVHVYNFRNPFEGKSSPFATD
jgi:3-oxoacyl-[acyl-carrier protein] reductase